MNWQVEQTAHSASYSEAFVTHSLILGAKNTVAKVLALTEVYEVLEK